MNGEEGRFPSPDALAEKTPGQSPYGYANANPLRFTDPTGLQAKTIWDGVKDGAVDGLMGLFYSTPPGWAVQGIQALMQGRPPAVSSLSGFANAYHTAIGDNGGYAQARLLTNIGVQVIPMILTGQAARAAVVDLGVADIGFSSGVDATLAEVAAAHSVEVTGLRTVTQAGITPSEALRIQNAADRIGKTIYVVGSRANGTASITSDWDYVIEGLTRSGFNKIKNSLPGAPMRADGMPRNMDVFKESLEPELPHVPFAPRPNP